MSPVLDQLNAKRDSDRIWNAAFDLFVLLLPICLLALALGPENGRGWMRAFLLALPMTLRLRGGGKRGRLKGLLLLQGVLTLLIAAVFLPLDEARSAGWFVGGILWDHPTLSPHVWLPEEEWAAFATWGMVAFGAAAVLVLGPFKLIFRSLMGPTRHFFAAVLRTALVGGLFGLLWAGSRLLF